MEIKGALGDMWGHLAAGISFVETYDTRVKPEIHALPADANTQPLTYTSNRQRANRARAQPERATRARTTCCYLHAAISNGGQPDGDPAGRSAATRQGLT